MEYYMIQVMGYNKKWYDLMRDGQTVKLKTLRTARREASAITRRIRRASQVLLITTRIVEKISSAEK